MATRDRWPRTGALGREALSMYLHPASQKHRELSAESRNDLSDSQRHEFTTRTFAYAISFLQIEI